MSSVPFAPGFLVNGPATLTFPTARSVFTGCSNQWGRNTYWQHGAWSVDIAAVQCASTCGSPIFSSGDWWVGYLREAGGVVRSDGKVVTITVPSGQEVLVYEQAPRDDSPWGHYRRLADDRLPTKPEAGRPQAHWTAWEYCTWVEQKALAGSKVSPRQVLNDPLVRQLAERILRLGLTPGKFTIDDGWSVLPGENGWNDGYWPVDTVKFPDLPGLCAWLIARGFTPGLWFGLPCLPAQARLRFERPELFGALEQFPGAETPVERSPWSLASSAATQTYLEDTLKPYAQMGFRKFKFDFFYGARHRMNALIQPIHWAVRRLSQAIEIEGHHPDFFFSRWIDACRLNDVLVQTGWDWEGLTLGHMRVTQLCAPDRIMNLDHLGGNDPAVPEADYLRHLALLNLAPAQQRRYPVLSLLPDRYSAETRSRVSEFIQNQSS